ncbi:hypothetical protein PQR05_29340 [Paraburkholderia sediminicola]|uniref:hypothetical protein n=1 Tax=Paraburkholderia sediminicola TaxID=458836 RepID=UPI0038BC4062
MASPTATGAFVRAVRKFAVQTPAWVDAVRYDTKPDECFDITLVAQRVYGDRSLAIVVFAAAGLDTMEQPLPAQRIVLPTYAQLNNIKRQTGYLTDEEARAYASLD